MLHRVKIKTVLYDGLRTRVNSLNFTKLHHKTFSLKKLVTMAPDVTFAWFIRHFTLSEELLLNASQISSCLLSSNCLWLTFNKSLKKDDEK